MAKVREILHELTPALSQVVVQASFAGVTIVYKFANSRGVDLRVLMAYRFMIATAILLPVALIIERKDKPKLTLLVLGQAFLCGLLGGSLFQNLYAQSLVFTSATFVSAIYNTIPAITFILAVLCRVEQLNLRTAAGKAKVAGTLTSMGGAMMLIFYKGTDINIWSTDINILKSTKEHEVHRSFSNPILGTVLAICFCFSYAINLIIQAKMMKKYPRPYLATSMSLGMGTVQATVFALCVERDWAKWKLGWNTTLAAASYTGIFGSAIAISFIMWGVRARGALYVSAFNPLMLIIVAIISSLILDEKLNIGSVVGGAIIICGLYVVLWGMSKQMHKNSDANHTQHFEEANSTEVKSSLVYNVPSDPDEEISVIIQRK